MFALSQTSASRRTLLSLGLRETALSAPDWPPGVFSSPTNPLLAHDALMVRPKLIKMNTCTKQGRGGRRFEIWFCSAGAFNSLGIILLRTNDEQLP